VSTLEEYVKGLDVLKIKVVQTYYCPGAHERASVRPSHMGAVHLTADIETPAIKSLSPMFDNCPKVLKKSLASAIGNEEAAFARALQILFDHLIVHEFTHGFQEKRRIRFGAAWLSELFADYTAYAFLKRFEGRV